jgi:hypothetical protein
VSNEQLEPFGLVLQSNPTRNVSDTPDSFLKDQIEEHRVVVMRGFAPLAGDAFPEFGKTSAQYRSGTSEQLTIFA